MKKWFFSLICMGIVFPLTVHAQEKQTYSTKDPKTGVVVSTKITKSKPIQQEINELKAAIAEAKKDPQRIQDGTVYKYERVLEQKIKQHEEIEKEKARRAQLLLQQKK
ncbi:MAG: hypothetical protein MK212_07115 [Saprospiraceae bacterium]|nr:hypothetical protein [Saprospiraceae bacterium]